MAGTVTVRMYNVGFGDAFLVTVDRSGRSWRMLVDCGVHSQGRARPIADVVAAIIGDLAAASPEGRPHLDVLVATHHHADHISGFAEDAWGGVAVDEVWLPFVEDATDPDATRLRTAHTVAAQGLELATARRLAAAGGGASPAVRAAHAFAVNSRATPGPATGCSGAADSGSPPSRGCATSRSGTPRTT